MKYQDNYLQQQHDDLHQNYESACCSSNFAAIRIADGDLSTFEERFLGEPMVFDEESEELSILLPIIKNNFKESKM